MIKRNKQTATDKDSFFSRIWTVAQREGVGRALACIFFRTASKKFPKLDCQTIFIESIKSIQGRYCVEGIIRDGTGSASAQWLRVFRLADHATLTVPLRAGKYRFYQTPGVSGNILDVYFFRFCLEDMPGFGDYSFNLQDGDETVSLKVGFGPNAPFSDRYSHSYCRFGKKLLVRSGVSSVRMHRWHFFRGILCETFLMVDLLRHRTLPETLAVFIRLSFPLAYLFLPRHVWVLSDKFRIPDDNGLALFRYLRKEHPNVSAYFLVSRDSPKREELSKFGKIIYYGSVRHFYFMLVAEAVVSSEAYLYVKPPTLMDPYANLTWKSLRVFLTHGILDSDNSHIYGRARESFDLIVASREVEANALTADPWGYDKEVVLLSGLSRYDYLQSSESKALTIMFTWRHYLTIGRNPKDKSWEYDQDFASSRYCQVLTALVSDIRIHNIASRKGLFIQVVLHPCLWPARKYFEFPNEVLVVADEKSFSEIVSESALFLTDYSSLYNDFIYLRKPVLFYQFDRLEFTEKTGRAQDFRPHPDDAPGPVCFTHEDAVLETLKTIDRSFKMDPKYTERIDNWFLFRDGLNCKRIYEAIQRKVLCRGENVDFSQK